MKLANVIATIFCVVLIGFVIWFLFLRSQTAAVEKNPATSPTTVETESLSSGLVSKKEEQASVTVTISPLSLFDAEWLFDVTLDTHSEELTIDLAKDAALLDNLGNTYQPISWDGSPPGGHHRSGVLKFDPISPKPSAITFEIYNLSGIPKRSFTWELE